MIPEATLSTIEGPNFGATLGVVSTPRAFDEAITAQPAVSDLLASLDADANIRSLTARILHLLRDPTNDKRFAHPRDLPVAVYMRALEVVQPSKAEEVADAVLQMPNLWWSRAVALKIKSNPAKRAPTVWRTHHLGEIERVVVAQCRALTNISLSWPPIVSPGVATGSVEMVTGSSTSTADVPTPMERMRIGAMAA